MGTSTIKHRLSDKNFLRLKILLLSHLFGSPGDMSASIFMSSLWVAESPEIEAFTPGYRQVGSVC